MMKDFIITGIPRSGTSLLCSLMNDLPNVVCFNEVVYNIESIPAAFSVLRAMLLAKEPVPNKLTTDTHATGKSANIKWETVSKPLNREVVIGLKADVPYLSRIQHIMSWGPKVIAMVRNPVYTIASWNLPKTAELNESDVRMDPRYRGFPFRTGDKYNCQAEVWNYFATIIFELRSHLLIIKYEDLIERTAETVQKVCTWLEIKCPATTQTALRSMNVSKRYPNIGESMIAASRYATIAGVFGYTIK